MSRGKGAAAPKVTDARRWDVLVEKPNGHRTTVQVTATGRTEAIRSALADARPGSWAVGAVDAPAAPPVETTAGVH